MGVYDEPFRRAYRRDRGYERLDSLKLMAEKIIGRKINPEEAVNQQLAVIRAQAGRPDLDLSNVTDSRETGLESDMRKFENRLDFVPNKYREDYRNNLDLYRDMTIWKRAERRAYGLRRE